MLFLNIYILTVIALAKCSKELRTMEPFIVGGEYVKIKNYPYAAFLNAICDHSNWMCGGAILNQILILTAAHCLSGCVFDKHDHRIDVYVGHEDVNKARIMRNGKYFVIHEDYNDRYTENDIGLLILDKNLPFGSTVKRTILTKYPSYSEGFVAGWGIENDETLYSSKKLKSVFQSVKPKSTCSKAGEVHPGVLCAGSMKKNVSRPSAGDSGSGFVNKINQVIGIVSWRNDNYPGLVFYSNTSYYYNWIVKNAYKLYCMKAKG